MLAAITQKAQQLPGKVLPFGYAGNSGMAKLDRMMQQHPKAYIVDIRLIPRSSWHRAFNKQALSKRFPKRYMHMPELGDLHSRPQDRQKGILLANPEKGITRLIKGMEQGYTIILLCSCSCKNKGCHRWTIITLLQEALLQEERKGQQ